MKKRKNTIFWITGAEGAGKSALVKILKKKLPNYQIHDFDDVGVPDNPPLSWRHKTTKHWIDLAQKKDLIIVGLSFPSEIIKFSKNKQIESKYLLLGISQKERKKRLKKKKVSKEIIKDVEQLLNLKKEFKKLGNSKIINYSNKTPKEVAEILVKWIK